MTKPRFRFEHKKNGDHFVLKPGSRTAYRFVCCGVDAPCNLTHDLYGQIDDAGNIKVTVFRNDEITDALVAEEALFDSNAVVDQDGKIIFQIIGDVGSEAVTNHRMFMDSAPAPRKVSNMRTEDRRRQRQLDALNADCFDADGVMRDGAVYRVPLHLRDSISTRDSRRERRRSFIDSLQVANTDKVAEARAVTAAFVTQEVMRNDPHLLASTFSDAELAAHRPGYRFADGSTTTEEEHHVTHRRRKTVYRDPLGREAGSSESNDSRNETEVAYAEMLDHMNNAWRTPPANFDAASMAPEAVGMPTRSLRSIPPPGGYWPLEAEGQVCDLNGVQGTVVREGDHCVCKPKAALRATRADAVPPSMTQDQASKITSAAYDEMLADLHSAWRS
jgi:hypothetical protein